MVAQRDATAVSSIENENVKAIIEKDRLKTENEIFSLQLQVKTKEEQLQEKDKQIEQRVEQ
jgi:hypothetical protein